ncbi:flavodoxin domain-containing protein [Candidatus Latescibacterota bacterium]
MKTLIIFASKHGCAEECAHKLKDKLSGETYIINIKDQSQIDLSNYGTVIIGGSIHAGKIQKNIIKFCRNNLSVLDSKKTGLYICCMEEGEKALKQFNDAFPAELIEHSTATGIFGGAFTFEKMNFIERYIIKKIAKIDKSVSKISEENITEFAAQIETSEK